MTGQLRPLPLALVGLGGYAAALLLIVMVPPAVVRDVGLVNSYAPLVLLLAGAHVCFWSGVLRSTRRGSLVALGLSGLLFLRLQEVLTVQLAVSWLVGCLGIECLVLLMCATWRQVHKRVQHRFGRQSALATPPSTDIGTGQPAAPLSSRRLRRPRQHHFFGK